MPVDSRARPRITRTRQHNFEPPGTPGGSRCFGSGPDGPSPRKRVCGARAASLISVFAIASRPRRWSSNSCSARWRQGCASTSGLPRRRRLYRAGLTNTSRTPEGRTRLNARSRGGSFGTQIRRRRTREQRRGAMFTHRTPRGYRAQDSGEEDSSALAEGVGFEPTIRFPVYTLSKRAPSATRPSLRGAIRGPAL